MFIKLDWVNKNSKESNSLLTKFDYLTMFITTIKKLCLQNNIPLEELLGIESKPLLTINVP